MFGAQTTGAANPVAYVDLLLRGCLELGAAPLSHETQTALDWLAVDAAARLVAMAMACAATRGRVLHVSGERGAERHRDVFAALELDAVPFAAWRERLERAGAANALAPLAHYFAARYPASATAAELASTQALLGAAARALFRPPTAADVRRVAEFYRRKRLLHRHRSQSDDNDNNTN